MFFLGVEEADSDKIPGHISSEFNRHTCDAPYELAYPSAEREDFKNLVFRVEIE
jgi:hypothetical protein